MPTNLYCSFDLPENLRPRTFREGVFTIVDQILSDILHLMILKCKAHLCSILGGWLSNIWFKEVPRTE